MRNPALSGVAADWARTVAGNAAANATVAAPRAMASSARATGPAVREARGIVDTGWETNWGMTADMRTVRWETGVATCSRDFFTRTSSKYGTLRRNRPIQPRRPERGVVYDPFRPAERIGRLPTVVSHVKVMIPLDSPDGAIPMVNCSTGRAVPDTRIGMRAKSAVESYSVPHSPVRLLTMSFHPVRLGSEKSV